ncbi:endosomal integral membrane protein, putative [Bodo saltans]|uniref:Transmembrane 9 superfamily member n=1 Tax=Bodo saltans TaxID=75058 RepID=A0A0S4JEU5_BODSA|nr:endosomal integral membrane protein, putative [Bodo saltans]|eukprot:CUG87696.1 endosomal integral membrane protein, putative [Bodo saltans]
MQSRTVAFILSVIITLTFAFYLRRVSNNRDWNTNHTNSRDDRNVEIQVKMMTSTNTHIPILYSSLPTCWPRKARSRVGNPGEILVRDVTSLSPYEGVIVGEDIGCQLVCNRMNMPEKQQKLLRKLITEEYHMNFVLDNLPLTTGNTKSGNFTIGVPLGFMEGSIAYIYNHLHFTIKYAPFHSTELHSKPAQDAKKGGGHRIISFEAKPYSIEHEQTKHETNPQSKCSHGNFTSLEQYKPLTVDANSIVWSFGVTWEESTKSSQETRWTVYLIFKPHEDHWVAMMNSAKIALFLTSLVAVMITFAVRRNRTKNSSVESDNEDREVTAWKFVRDDVRRPPSNPGLLAALVGTGSHLLLTTFMALVIACLRFVAPDNHAAFVDILLVLFTSLSMCAGYVSARFLMRWNKKSWKHIFAAGSIAPGISFLTFFVINMAVRAQSPAGAAPNITMIIVLSTWFFISLPLTVVGASVGFKGEVIKQSVPTNQTPLTIPPTMWHVKPWLTIAIGGIVPFSAVFTEVRSIFGALWLNQYYDAFGCLTLVMILMTIFCAEITVVFCYFQLRAENYYWAWRAFFTSGSCGVYLFLYAVYYFFTSLRMTSVVSILIYFGYMTLLSFLFCIMTGTIAFLACYWFTRCIYDEAMGTK